MIPGVCSLHGIGRSNTQGFMEQPIEIKCFRIVNTQSQSILEMTTATDVKEYGTRLLL